MSYLKLHWLSLLPTICAELFPRYCHLVEKVLNGELPRYIQASLPSSELLDKLKLFTVMIQGFKKERPSFSSIDIHNALHWVESFSDPPTDVISSWNHVSTVVYPNKNPECDWNNWQDSLRERGFQLQ
ncbi:hypothetical protein C8J57DRAFT_1249664 [Mycena rebaudengoi]|nr:hypothetical protein C8J57DRAFT_1249664 [Mycena rebaudengoi]